MANVRRYPTLLVTATCLLMAGTASSQTAPPAPPAPAATSPAQAKPAPADDNAFPEEQSKAAQKAADAGDKSASDGPADAGSPPENTDVPESSSRSRIKGIDVLGDRDSHSDNGAGGFVNDPKLAQDDIRIGQLYMGRGNYPGAYERFKEATEVNPGNADAVFYRAEAARKTARLDEAATNYKTYLDADPKGKRAKDARKALQELAGK